MAQQEKGKMGNFSVIGVVEGIEIVDGKTYSYVLFHTKSNEKGKIPHRIFTGRQDVVNLTEGDLVEFYCKLTASLYQGRTYYNPEIKAFYVIKKAEAQDAPNGYVEVEDKSGQDNIPF